MGLLPAALSSAAAFCAGVIGICGTGPLGGVIAANAAADAAPSSAGDRCCIGDERLSGVRLVTNNRAAAVPSVEVTGSRRAAELTAAAASAASLIVRSPVAGGWCSTTFGGLQLLEECGEQVPHFNHQR